jgi:hypothetical protein
MVFNMTEEQSGALKVALAIQPEVKNPSDKFLQQIESLAQEIASVSDDVDPYAILLQIKEIEKQQGLTGISGNTIRRIVSWSTESGVSIPAITERVCEKTKLLLDANPNMSPASAQRKARRDVSKEMKSTSGSGLPMYEGIVLAIGNLRDWNYKWFAIAKQQYDHNPSTALKEGYVDENGDAIWTHSAVASISFNKPPVGSIINHRYHRDVYVLGRAIDPTGESKPLLNILIIKINGTRATATMPRVGEVVKFSAAVDSKRGNKSVIGLKDHGRFRFSSQQMVLSENKSFSGRLNELSMARLLEGIMKDMKANMLYPSSRWRQLLDNAGSDKSYKDELGNDRLVDIQKESMTINFGGQGFDGFIVLPCFVSPSGEFNFADVSDPDSEDLDAPTIRLWGDPSVVNDPDWFEGYDEEIPAYVLGTVYTKTVTNSYYKDGEKITDTKTDNRGSVMAIIPNPDLEKDEAFE